jgi:ArsR family transcriptional regulator
MKLLVEAALITREQRGKWAYYRVVDQTLTAISQALEPIRRS